MTLTISMSCIPSLSKALNLTSYTTQIAMSLSFFMFSISAILFATLSDVFTAKKVLYASQALSVFGLCSLGLSNNVNVMYMGFVCLGLGTGCYSSIGRALISRNAIDTNAMKKSYAIMSCCIIVAPIISTYLALFLIPISWRFAYIAMAMIELALFIYSLDILKIDAKTQVVIAPTKIVSGFKHALSNPQYVLNVAIVATFFSFYLAVLMSSFKGLVVDELGMSINYFTVLFLMASMSYIVGIFTYRYKADKVHKKRYNVGIIIVFLVLVVYYTESSINSFYVIFSLHAICFILGFFIPLATGVAMSNITKGHGSAAAMITFSVSMTMAVWEAIRAHLNLSNYEFILLALWISLTIVIVLKILLFFIENKSKITNG
ncbi:multidrug effflux MFS transporter [Francisella sp. Scap27]|nr:multidrug effflux MFS transporter [Francisella sp. Scap27]